MANTLVFQGGPLGTPASGDLSNCTGAGGSLSVSDGSTTVDPCTAIVFSGATVTDGGGGEADVAVSGGGGNGKTQVTPVTLDDCAAFFVGTPANALPSYTYHNPDPNTDDAVGSTMTADANGELTTIDGGGYTPQVGDRIGVADQSSLLFGIFTITDLGADDPAGSPWILTRATDSDTQATFVRCWITNATGGSVFNGGVLQSGLHSESNPLSVDDFSTSGSCTVQTSTGTAWGAGAIVTKPYGTAVGYAIAAEDAVAIGYGAQARNLNCSALGSNTLASGTSATAIGNLASATAENAIAIGNNVSATTANQTAIQGFLSIPTQSGVPTDPPLGIPLNFDSTAVSGGLYGWTGAAWVKMSVTP